MPHADFIEHYQQVDENTRLSTWPGVIELTRTQEIILRHLAKPPLVVLDVGGGPGVYARWLAGLGYAVHLVDPVPKHVEQARAAGVANAVLGDARRLDFSVRFSEAVLLLGPLYHLTERAERLLALTEARRVLKPGGLLFAAAICRFASLVASLHEGFVDEPNFQPMLARALDEGQHRNATDDPRRFTTAFFHRPEELAEEVRSAGFELVDLLGVEGPCWLARDFDARWADADRRRLLLDLARRVEHEPALYGVSPHLIAVARANR